MANSESLEHLEKQIVLNSLTLAQSVSELVRFAKNKLDLSLNEVQIFEKLEQVAQSFQGPRLDTVILKISAMQASLHSFNMRVRALHQRISVELDPAIFGLQEVNQQVLAAKVEKQKQTILELAPRERDFEK